jgi:DNA-binding LytR/AlgR family response regulator
MKVLIIEDESQTAKRLEELITRYDPETQLLGIIPSVHKALAYFAQPDTVKPDLMFLDIHLEDDLGFRILEDLQMKIPVIFTTAFDEYALQAFKTFSIDYLLKPIDYEELCKAIDKYKSIVFKEPEHARIDQFVNNYHKNKYKDRFMVSSGSRLKSIPVSDIAYFSYERKTTLVNTTDGKFYPLDYSLEKLLELLDPGQFFRVNRTHVISLTSIASINQYPLGKLLVELDPKARMEVSVSADRVTPFKIWLGK